MVLWQFMTTGLLLCHVTISYTRGFQPFFAYVPFGSLSGKWMYSFVKLGSKNNIFFSLVRLIMYVHEKNLSLSHVSNIIWIVYLINEFIITKVRALIFIERVPYKYQLLHYLYNVIYWSKYRNCTTVNMHMI